MVYTHRDYEGNPLLAAKPIALLLRTGCLSLFLGAGISRGFGFPDWALLIARMLKRGADQPYIESLRTKSAVELGKLIDNLDDGGPIYHSLVHTALYEGISPNLLEQLTKSPLLLAVAALLTGTRRGRIQHIYTYNYDNLLEQYLKMLGYFVCVRQNPSNYSTWADVEINHVHGFLPQFRSGADSVPELILSEKSYRNRRAEIGNGWALPVETSLYSKIALLLGLSGDDSSILDVFQRAKNRIERAGEYNGYWLLTPDAYDRNASSVVDIGMCPIRLDRSMLPAFLFSICQEAIP